jgi:hypothetical protein
MGNVGADTFENHQNPWHKPLDFRELAQSRHKKPARTPHPTFGLFLVPAITSYGIFFYFLTVEVPIFQNFPLTSFLYDSIFP